MTLTRETLQKVLDPPRNADGKLCAVVTQTQLILDAAPPPTGQPN